MTSERRCQSAVDMQHHNPSHCSVCDSGPMHLTESMVIEMLINLSQNTFFVQFPFLKYDPMLDRPNLTVMDRCLITVLLNFLYNFVVVS